MTSFAAACRRWRARTRPRRRARLASRSSQAARAAPPPRAGLLPGLAHAPRAPRTARGPSRALRRRRDLVGAERRAVAAAVPALVGRAEADDGAAGDQRRLGARRASAQRRGDRLGVVAVDRACTAQPGRARSAPAGRRCRTGGVAVDRDAVVVVQHGQPVELQMPGEAIASWLMPSIRQPSPAITQVRWSTRSAPKRAASMPLGQRHADRGGQPLAERPGGGLDARMLAVFGMAGGWRAAAGGSASARRSPMPS